MAEFHTQVLLCWPANRAEIARLNTMLTPAEQFAPSVEHTLTTCDGCGRSVWIGPQQLSLARSPLIAVRKMCLACASGLQRTLGLTAHQIDINPELSSVPRRF